jgi:hypothetical protein
VDQKDLGVERYDAGRDYLAALRHLRLEPEALFWAYDKSMGQLVLVLVTSLFDFAWPLRVDSADLKGAALDRATISGEFKPSAVASFGAVDLESFGTWVYKSTPSSTPPKISPGFKLGRLPPDR